MRLLPIVLLVTLMFAAACGGGSAPVEGAAVFQERCAACHGARGEGSDGPRLHGQATVEIVNEGRPRQGMPAFQDELSDDEIEAVVAYANTLNR